MFPFSVLGQSGPGPKTPIVPQRLERRTPHRYGLITEEEAQRAERYDALMEHSEAIANAPKKQTEAYKKLLAIPGASDGLEWLDWMVFS